MLTAIEVSHASVYRRWFGDVKAHIADIGANSMKILTGWDNVSMWIPTAFSRYIVIGSDTVPRTIASIYVSHNLVMIRDDLYMLLRHDACNISLTSLSADNQSYPYLYEGVVGDWNASAVWGSFTYIWDLTRRRTKSSAGEHVARELGYDVVDLYYETQPRHFAMSHNIAGSPHSRDCLLGFVDGVITSLDTRESARASLIYKSNDEVKQVRNLGDLIYAVSAIDNMVSVYDDRNNAFVGTDIQIEGISVLFCRTKLKLVCI